VQPLLQERLGWPAEWAIIILMHMSAELNWWPPRFACAWAKKLFIASILQPLCRSQQSTSTSAVWAAGMVTFLSCH